LPLDQRIATRDGETSERRAMPAELLPSSIHYGPIEFAIGAPKQAVAANGQTLSLPKDTRRVYVLLAADGDQRATFRIGDDERTIIAQDSTGFIGQWDTRLWEHRVETLPPRPDAPPNAPPRTTRGLAFAGVMPGFVKPADVAWLASHRHDPAGKNEAYAYSYLFAQAFDVPPGATSITLPQNDRIHIVAVTASNEETAVRPAQPLYDTLRR
jgi:alpha-mannosidase